MASLGQKLDKLEGTRRPGLNLSICSKMWMHNNWLCCWNWLASGKRLKKVAICMNMWDNLILASFCVFWAKSHFAHPWSHPSILEISHWLKMSFYTNSIPKSGMANPSSPFRPIPMLHLRNSTYIIYSPIFARNGRGNKMVERRWSILDVICCWR